MAITSSNSNSINIADLPQTQEAVNGDLLLIQTDSGIQTIDFQNFNVVKTDAAGNATVEGGLSGGSCNFTNIKSSETVSSLNFTANDKAGVFAPAGYYNVFTITGGLVTSASYVLGSPEYQYINNTVLPALTTFQNTIYRIVVDESSNDPGQSYVTINANNVSQAYNIAGFFNRHPDISPGSIQPQHILLTSTVPLSTCPYVTNVLNDGLNGLTFTANAGYRVKEESPLYWRLLYTYTTT